MTVPRPAAILFDAYGTLFDVYAVSAVLDRLRPGRGQEAALWLRTRQIDYTRLRTLADRYIDFHACTSDALHWVNAKLQLGLADDEMAAVMNAYETLPLHADVGALMSELSRLAIPLGILSNGTPAMLRSAIQAAGLVDAFRWVLSVDTVKRYKTAPEAYQLGVNAVGTAAHNIMFVSANGWDAACATWFGYRTFWVNRHGDPPEVLCEPTTTGTTLAGLTKCVAYDAA
jgi:2-haloacid dehalogenase